MRHDSNHKLKSTRSSMRHNNFRIFKEQRSQLSNCDAKPHMHRIRYDACVVSRSMRLSRDERLVEPAGIEPATSCLQSRRSPS